MAAEAHDAQVSEPRDDDDADGWRERVCAALSTLLALLEEQSRQARLSIDDLSLADALASERRRALAALARVLLTELQADATGERWFIPAGPEDDPAPVHLRAPVRTTYRTTRVLNAISESPGLSNRKIAQAAGLTDEGQTSKLLRRLQQRGLVANFGLGQQGGANAWQLTANGERVLDATRQSLAPGAGAVSGRGVRRRV
jgi:hypothetical protein